MTTDPRIAAFFSECLADIHFDRARAFAEPDPEDDEDDGDGDGDWQTELQDSPRPESLKKSILAWVAALAALAALLPRSVEQASSGVQAEAQLAAALDRFEAAAKEATAEHAPVVVAQITKYVLDSTGLKQPLSTDKPLADLSAKVAQYLTDGSGSMKKAAQVAVANWRVAGGTPEELRAALGKVLEGADCKARRVVVTEIQESYKAQFRQATDQAGTKKIERICMPTACELCVGLCGVHEADDPDLYNDHPQCQCVYVAVPDDTTVD